MDVKIFSGKEKRKPKMNLVVFGQPGAGKTIFATSGKDHPDLDDVLFLNIEGGELSITDRELDWAKPGRDENDNPTGRTLKDIEEVAIAIASKKKGYEKYRTVVVDSVTELQVRDLEDITKGSGRADGEIHRNDYGKNTNRMRRALRLLRDADVNVIFTALAKKVMVKKKGSEDTELGEIIPDMTAKLAESIMGYVDFVWYMFVDAEGNRCLLTQEKGPVRAKTRNIPFAAALGPVVKNPDMKVIYDLLLSSTGNKENKQ